MHPGSHAVSKGNAGQTPDPGRAGSGQAEVPPHGVQGGARRGPAAAGGLAVLAVLAILMGALLVACGSADRGLHAEGADLGTGGGACGSCGSPLGCCGTRCVNLKTDVNNCGGCGVLCPLGQSCIGGQCLCAGPGGQGAVACDSKQGRACCAGQCVDLSSSDTHCGSCGGDCTAAGETCAGGRCACGKVGGHCPAPQVCCAGACSDTSVDASNCGACGVGCAMGDSCQGGSCSGGGGGPGGCMSSKDCPMGQTCVAGMCINAGLGNCMPPCPQGQICVNLLNQNTCIGAGGQGCGQGCAQGQMCLGGLLCSCASDKDCNGGKCRVLLLGLGICA